MNVQSPLNKFGRREVPVRSLTSLQPRRGRPETLLRPQRLVENLGRRGVAKRLQTYMYM